MRFKLVENTQFQDIKISSLYNKFKELSYNELLNYIGKESITDKLPEGPSFIDPQGNFIEVTEDTHAMFFDDVLFDFLSDQKLSSIDFIDYEDYDNISEFTYDYVDDFEENFNLIRLNTGTITVEDRCYCVLSPEINSKQISALEIFINNWYDNLENNLVVCADTQCKEYTHEYFPEDIMKRIKRFYSSGRLYESAKH